MAVPQASRPLIALNAQAWLTASEALGADARLAPSDSDRIALALLAQAAVTHLRRLLELLGDQGSATAAQTTADEVMPAALDQLAEPAVIGQLSGYADACASFSADTTPANWEQALLRIVLVAGFALDAAAALQTVLGPQQIQDSFGDPPAWQGHDYAAGALQAALSADPGLRDRLALYGRRLLAEAVSQAQRILAQDPHLCAVLAPGNSEAAQLTGAGKLLESLVTSAARRMGLFGLMA